MLRAKPCGLVFEPSSSRVDLIERDFFPERGGGRGANAQRRLPALEWSTDSVFGGSGGLGGPRRLFSISSAVAATKKKPLACSRFLPSALGFLSPGDGMACPPARVRTREQGPRVSFPARARPVAWAPRKCCMMTFRRALSSLPPLNNLALSLQPPFPPPPKPKTGPQHRRPRRCRVLRPRPRPVSLCFPSSILEVALSFLFFECLRRDPRPSSALPIKSLS